MIGSLLYLTTSKPDIVFHVGLCARFQSNPKKTHLKATKRILRYLKYTSDLALQYTRGCNFDLIGYANADYAGFLIDRKSTSRMAHFLGHYLVSWALFGLLGNQETTLRCHVHSRSRVCSGNFLLCSIVVDKAITQGLFC